MNAKELNRLLVYYRVARLKEEMERTKANLLAKLQQTIRSDNIVHATRKGDTGILIEDVEGVETLDLDTVTCFHVYAKT